MKISTIEVGKLIIEGIEGDYVFETIRKDKRFYEDDLLKKWLPYLESCKVILDVGANLGNHTLFWSQNIHYQKIIAFEPFAPSYERLTHNVCNNFLKNVWTINKGIGSQKGYTIVKEFNEDNYGGTTLETDIKSEGEIEITDIDSFAEENNLDKIDFVKIDTEGFEESVLAGMQEVVKRDHPDLWIEVGHQSFHNIVQSLFELEYIMVDISGFNILFLHPDRHDGIKNIDRELIMEALFYNLERVNLYYKNYITAKGWGEKQRQKNECLKEKNAVLQQNLQDANKKYRKSLENYQTAKEWAAAKEQELQQRKKEIELLQQEKQELEEKNGVIVEKLSDCLKDYDLSIANAEQLTREMKRLEMQNSALVQKNSEFQHQMDIVGSTRFGKLGIKVYEIYSRFIKNREK